MTIFHIKYPRKRGFLKWDELGCLSRALGFQVDLFRDNLTDEIVVENDGISVEEVLKMLEYRILYKVLHHTVNMHTAEWNMAAIRKSIILLSHKALTFEEIHNVRVAYQLYEAGDMKGMMLDKHTLLRSLKMCGRTIAPLKLMHRIKHMKEDFEEVGRIQISEYFDLILWCDLYYGFNPKEIEYPDGKENKLFKLVDFDKLLSHHDERVSWALNQQYLRDEWDFGLENLGSKEMFKEPPITNEARIHQTKLHKRKYRHLKHEVGTSQKRVYCAHAGYIRDRPITAPDLSMYKVRAEETETARTTAQDAYQSVRRRLKSAPPSTRASMYTDRPSTRQYTRQATPPAVTVTDLSEVETKMNCLTFDLITVESKYEINKAEKMDYFLPGYREKLAKRPPPSPPPPPKKEIPKSTHWTEEVIENLVHPTNRGTTTHDIRCDAKQRGWHSVKKKTGSHYVLVSTSYDNTLRGRLMHQLHERTYGPVKHLHKDHLHRRTSSHQVEHGKGRLAGKRPVTAPATISNGHKKSGNIRGRSQVTGQVMHYQTPPSIMVSNNSSYDSEHSDVVKAESGRNNEEKEENDDIKFHFKTVVKDQNEDVKTKEEIERVADSRCDAEKPVKDFNRCRSDGYDNTVFDSVDIPVPPMRHSKPKIVEVGHIGTISLLEKIDESQDLEDRFSQTSNKYSDTVSDTGHKSDELRPTPVSSPPLYIKFSQENEIHSSTPRPPEDDDDDDDDDEILVQDNLKDKAAPSKKENCNDDPPAFNLKTGLESELPSQEDSKPQSKTVETDLFPDVFYHPNTQATSDKDQPTVKHVHIVLDSEAESSPSVCSDKKNSSISRDKTAGLKRLHPEHRSRSASGVNRTSFRLVQRVRNSISPHLQMRLLMHGKC